MSEVWDVIVVGAGSSGLPAAIKAAERGAKVLQLEADNRTGGTLHWSSGQISAAGTKLQAKLGIEDSPDAHFEEAQRIAHDLIDPLTLRMFVDEAASMIDWLMDNGLEPLPDHPVAGEAHEPYRTRRYLWGPEMGISIMKVLQKLHAPLVEAGKIDLRLGHRLSRILTDDAGAAIGVAVTLDDGASAEFHAKNVVLACGGYVQNPDLWGELTPDFPLCSFANPYSRGDGIVAARDLGASIDGSEKFLNTFAGYLEDPDDPLTGQFLGLSPKARSIWEIFVNKEGKRFMCEDHPSVDYRERSLLNQPNLEMFIVFDEGIFQNASKMAPGLSEEEYRSKYGTHPHWVKADTLGGLAQQLGLPAHNLEETVAKYNGYVEAGEDAEFGRHFLIRPLTKPPYYGLVARGITVLSPAGLKHDEHLRVMKEDGTAIENLYIAGEIMGFGRTSGDAFVGGLSLSPALTFGKILGEKLLNW